MTEGENHADRASGYNVMVSTVLMWRQGNRLEWKWCYGEGMMKEGESPGLLWRQ